MGVVTRDYDVFGAIRRSCDTFARTIIRCFWGGLTDLPLHMRCGLSKCIAWCNRNMCLGCGDAHRPSTTSTVESISCFWGVSIELTFYIQCRDGSTMG